MEKDNLEKYILTETILKLNHGWKDYPSYEFDEICAICLGSMKENYILELECNHKYHYDCILMSVIGYYKYNCPDCNKQFRNN